MVLPRTLDPINKGYSFESCTSLPSAYDTTKHMKKKRKKKE
jgi:hypothetical protein